MRKFILPDVTELRHRASDVGIVGSEPRNKNRVVPKAFISSRSLEQGPLALTSNADIRPDFAREGERPPADEASVAERVRASGHLCDQFFDTTFVGEPGASVTR